MNDNPDLQKELTPEQRRCFPFLALVEDKDYFENEDPCAVYRLRLPVEGEDIEEHLDGPAHYVLVIHHDGKWHFRLGVRVEAADLTPLLFPPPESDAVLKKLFILTRRGERVFLIGGEPSFDNPTGTGVYTLEDLPGARME